ncbi:MAG TPA: CAP domain-containing protein [Acidimicrobiia bacterium]|nr:CAP domain-containing protein [Acidimicrobiia bacterium]
MRWTRRATLLAATAAIVVVVAACVPIKPGPPAAPSIPFGSAHPQAQELYYLVNAERAANGLGPVGWHDQLGGLTQGWSEHMAGSGNFSHQNLDAILQSPGYSGFSGLGENIIHGGCGISSSQLHQAWMASPLHRANILGDFNAVGVGVACNGGELYATEDFGR